MSCVSLWHTQHRTFHQHIGRMFIGGAKVEFKIAAGNNGSEFCWAGDVGRRGGKVSRIGGDSKGPMMKAPISAAATVAVPGWLARKKARVIIMRASAEAAAETQWVQGRVGPLSHHTHPSAAPPRTATLSSLLYALLVEAWLLAVK